MAFAHGQMIEIQPFLDGEWHKARYHHEIGEGLHLVTCALTDQLGLPIDRIRICQRPCCKGEVRIIDDTPRSAT
jgi:hypothetical protein